MSSLLDRIPRRARVVVIRLRSLGDCVLTTPALALLHQSRPDLHIGVVAEPQFAPVFAGNPAVSAILPPVAAEVRRWHADFCLNLHGGTRSAWLTVASGARLRAGFGHFRFQPVYNVRIPRAQDILGIERTVHTAEHLASALFYLGVPEAEIPPARLFAAPAPAGTREYAVIHPFASAADKTWPAQEFVALARHLVRQMDVIFIGAGGDDLTPFRSFATAQGRDLEQLKSLLAGASLFIGNDSGPAHMAAAFGLPLILLWGNSIPEIWAPWKREHTLLRDPRGVERIRVESVLEAVERMRVQA